jgi:AcrR family transcriptional regulator
MTANIANNRKKRGRATREDWLAAALEALHREGPKGVNIKLLAARLKISKTSFYWHFKNKSDLIDALIGFWIHEMTEIVTLNTELLALPPRDRLLRAMEMIDKFDLAHYDLAFRVWGRTEPRVQKALRKVNKLRMDFARSLFTELGFEGNELSTRVALFVCYHSAERYVFPEFSAAKRKRLREERLKILISRP